MVWAILSVACVNKKADSAKSEAMHLFAVDSLLSTSGDLVGKVVAVEGFCTHVCSKGGMRLFLASENQEKTIRVKSNDWIVAFDPDCINRIVRVSGTLMEDRIDENYLQRMEQQTEEEGDEGHGKDGSGCVMEQKAEGVKAGSSRSERIGNFRARIAERKEKEAKETSLSTTSLPHITKRNYRIKNQSWENFHPICESGRG